MAHNFLFLNAAAKLEGRRAESMASARGAFPHVAGENLHAMPGFELAMATPALTLVRFGHWEAVLDEPEPPADLLAPSGLWHYARGRAFTALGRLDDAAREQAPASDF